MKPRTCKPPIHRLLWRAGVEIRPPHYATFLSNLVFIATAFSVLWGSIMWLAVWSHWAIDISVLIGAVLVAGGLFGALLAGLYWYGRKKHRLTVWEKLTA